ncbi:MAG: hypothetical protein GY777_31475, partial [Candidatus Brocadiaceae bacterium]|nr:hypothetical protein [Candidatus Brocadiaceae bacterium]
MDFRILFARTITTSILLLFITISTSYAEQAATSSGGTSASVGTDPNTGAASVSVPIEVPPGRNGMAPNLALTYNSNKRNGWLGVGWDMKTSFIQRNTKWGLDYSDNDYVADGNRELVERGDWGAYSYGQKTEGAFIKYYYNGSGGWVATTKNGTKHYYGTTATSRQDDPNDSSRVFKWMIDRVEDTNGNYITYTYTKDQGEIYLDKIDYTGGNGLSPTNYVKFYYDDSRTDVSLMYTSNFQVKVSKRLITIEAVSNGSMVRAYKLEYDADPQTSGLQYSASTSRSILYSVQQYGMDATLDTYGVVTGGTYIPAMEMMWQDDVNETFGPRIADAGGVNFVGYTRAMSDVNGDGKSDIIYINETDFSVYLSQGDGTFGPRIADAGGVDFVGYTRAMSDVNGDGKSDIIYINETDFSVYLSQGDGTFGPRIADAGGVNFVSYTRAMSDVNGDGKSDIIYINETDFSVYLSQGDGTFGPRIADAGG